MRKNLQSVHTSDNSTLSAPSAWTRLTGRLRHWMMLGLKEIGVGKKARTLPEIQEISEILYQHNCVWSLQSGNVLGIQRNEGLRHDEDDIDIAVLAEHWHVGIEEEIRARGYKLSVYDGGIIRVRRGFISPFADMALFSIYTPPLKIRGMGSPTAGTGETTITVTTLNPD